MPERMIPCVVCEGTGSDSWNVDKCLECKGAGTIPDRRAPTANDRAVKRIKLLIKYIGSLSEHGAYMNGRFRTAEAVKDIINEETERDD